MFKMVSSPHTHSSNLTANFMLWVIAMMLPALGVQIYYFGFGVLIQILLAIVLAIVIEIAIAKLRKKNDRFLSSRFIRYFNRIDSCYVDSALCTLLDCGNWRNSCLIASKT